MSAPRKRARAKACQSSGSRGNRERASSLSPSYSSSGTSATLSSLSRTAAFQKWSAISSGKPLRTRIPSRLDTSCLASSHILAGTYRSRCGLASKTCPRSLSNSPTSVLASTTSRKPLAAYALTPRLL